MSEKQYRENHEAVRRAVEDHLADHHHLIARTDDRSPQPEQGVVREDLPILNPAKSVPRGTAGGRGGLVEPDKELTHSDQRGGPGLDRGSFRGGSRP